ncbi:unnamed protein product, partial [Polarella glacialis]
SSFAECLRACERVSLWERSVALFESMERWHIMPNSSCANAVIGACDKAGEWRQ